MQNAITVKGRLTGPKSVELDEPVAGMTTEVEVLIHPAQSAQIDQTETVSHFLRRLPAGKRSKEQIDQQIRAERSAWGDR